MKKGAFFINSARGEIVDESALIDALESGQLAGAAVDVISNEFTSVKNEHPMIKYAKSHKNLIVTPHIAGLTFESEFKAAQYSLNQVFKSLGVMK
jgi:phosphoglycerate dehydrogenase-like enzyme